MDSSNSKPVMLASLTAQEFISMLKNDLPFPELERERQEEKKYVYGLKGFANLLDVSYQTAYRIKKGGKFDKAISQIGRKIIIDSDMVMDILKNQNQ